MDNGFIFFIFSGNVNADLNMRALYFMVKSLADIMEQSGTSGHRGIKSEFGCHNACKIGHFQRMFQNILTIAGTEMKSADEFDEFGMYVVDTCFYNSTFTL